MTHRHFTTNHFKSSQQERSKPSTGQHVYRDGVRDLLPNLQPRSAVSSTAVLQTHVLRELPGDALAVHGEPRTPDNVSAVPSHHAAVGGENPRDPAGRRGHFWAACNRGLRGGRRRHRGTQAGRGHPTYRGNFSPDKIAERTTDEMLKSPMQESHRGCTDKWVFHLLSTSMCVWMPFNSLHESSP